MKSLHISAATLLTLLLVLLCCPPRNHGCNVYQRMSTAMQFNLVWLSWDGRKFIALESWRGLLEAYPELIDTYFTKVNGHNILSMEFKLFTMRTFTDVNIAFSYLHYDETCANQLQYVSKIHKRYHGLEQKHFDAFGRSLAKAAHEFLGKKSDPGSFRICTQYIMDNIQWKPEEHTEGDK